MREPLVRSTSWHRDGSIEGIDRGGGRCYLPSEKYDSADDPCLRLLSVVAPSLSGRVFFVWCGASVYPALSGLLSFCPQDAFFVWYLASVSPALFEFLFSGCIFCLVPRKCLSCPLRMSFFVLRVRVWRVSLLSVSPALLRMRFLSGATRKRLSCALRMRFVWWPSWSLSL